MFTFVFDVKTKSKVLSLASFETTGSTSRSGHCKMRRM
uniref:Uncharacterized protein n=1 Tax=Anguilla anguilla TaxID=7936 RepID=A0A0E9RBQ4_ANGAN